MAGKVWWNSFPSVLLKLVVTGLGSRELDQNKRQEQPSAQYLVSHTSTSPSLCPLNESSFWPRTITVSPQTSRLHTMMSPAGLSDWTSRCCLQHIMQQGEFNLLVSPVLQGLQLQQGPCLGSSWAVGRHWWDPATVSTYMDLVSPTPLSLWESLPWEAIGKLWFVLFSH